jgi:uncharacterized protein
MKAKRTSAKPKRAAVKRRVAAKPRSTRSRATAGKSTTKPRRPAAKRKIATRKAAPRRATVTIPAMLLEGDHPTSPVAGGPGEKFALGPTPPEQHFESESAELPESYGTGRLYLTARDPHWLYANWDLTRNQQLHYNQQSADGHLILRIFADTSVGKPVLEIHVHPESRHWFVPVGGIDRAGAKYAAELGFYRKGRGAVTRESRKAGWTSVATSGATLTPPETVSSGATVEFATIPVDVPFEKLLALVALAAREHRPLAQAVEALRQAGHPELPPVAALPTAPWTPEQERALAEIVNLDHVRRVWIGSLEITELIRRQLERGISSLGLLPQSGTDVSSISSPFGGEQPRGKGFWFNVNAELIIYGATEPDASVTIGGRKIKLRRDGSFTCRFSFPDGRYDLPVVAVSADDTDGRAAELKFSRATDFLGDVGAQPQDPALKPPTPDNVA